MPATPVVGAVGGAGTTSSASCEMAVVLQCAETVGAVDRVFEFTLEYAFDRFSFGRPLASYQALKHRFADMKLWLEACHATATAAAQAVGPGPTTPPSWSAWPSPTSATTPPRSSRTACRCTAASASPGTTTSICTCGGSRKPGPVRHARPSTASASPRSSGCEERTMNDATELEDVESFRLRARAWLAETMPRLPDGLDNPSG